MEALADIVPRESVAFAKPPNTSPFDLLVERERNGNWQAVWDDFRNWVGLSS
jgi:hypothetical protein